jgi:hypothetical protein
MTSGQGGAHTPSIGLTRSQRRTGRPNHAHDQKPDQVLRERGVAFHHGDSGDARFRSSRAETTGTVTYKASTDQTITLFDTGLLYISGCADSQDRYLQDPSDPNVPDPITCLPDAFPGTMWFRVNVGLRDTVVNSQPASLSVSGPETVAQGDEADITTTLSPSDGEGKEAVVSSAPFVRIDVAYDACSGPFGCPDTPRCAADHITTVEQLVETKAEGCIDFVNEQRTFDLTTFKLLEQDGTLPFAGAKEFTGNKDIELLDLLKLIGLGTGDADKEEPEEKSPVTFNLKFRLSTLLSMVATDGYHAVKTLTASSDRDNPIVTGPVSFTSSKPQDDRITIPCSVPAGAKLTYKLSENAWDGTGTAKSSVSAILSLGLLWFKHDATLYESPEVTVFDGAVHAKAGDVSGPVGEVVAETTPPTIATIAHSGTLAEGSETQFSAVATDNCTTDLLYQWNYSDGGVGYGPTTHHTFADNGMYTGVLTVTDAAGNATSRNFSVTIANADPSVTPPPGASAAWGVAIQFHADVFDPSPVDQSTLKVQWDFGDGTGAAGIDVAHTYSAPGAYPITLRVTDKEGATGTASMSAQVVRRSTTVGMLGDGNVTYDTTASYGASLTDELGNPVPGRTLVLGTVGSPATVAAITDTNGIARATQMVTSQAGTYQTTATFAGDNLFEPSSASTSTNVGKKATSVQYTGPLTSRPNKTLTLTARLADADGKALAGRTLVFNLGSQAVSAVTDANGTAAAVIKLAQKPGNYPLSVSYGPVGDDTGRYVGSAASATFRVG